MQDLMIWLTQDVPANALEGIRFEAQRYAIGTLGVFFAIWIALEPLLKNRKIRKPTPRKKQVRMELANSFKTICVFVALDIVIFDLGQYGIFQKYDDIAEYGWVWYWISIPLALAIHDTYFYWTHRAMHSPALYKRFHLTHHRSHNPTPFTAYSFAVGEAVVEYAVVPMILIMMPMHDSALAIYLLIMIFKNASAHCGYELFPRGTTRNPILKHLTTVTHHDMHHQYANGGNYGFYFTFWDKLMGTEHPDYEARFDEVTAGKTRWVQGETTAAA